MNCNLHQVQRIELGEIRELSDEHFCRDIVIHWGPSSSGRTQTTSEVTLHADEREKLEVSV